MYPYPHPSPEEIARSLEVLREIVPPGVSLEPLLGGWLKGPPSPDLPQIPSWRTAGKESPDLTDWRIPLQLFDSEFVEVVSLSEFHEDIPVAKQILARLEEMGVVIWDEERRLLIENKPMAQYFDEARCQASEN